MANKGFIRIFLNGRHPVSVFLRLYENWQAEWKTDPSLYDPSAPPRTTYIQPTYELELEEPITQNTLIVHLYRTTGSMQETEELFHQHMIANGIYNYVIDYSKSDHWDAPDPVTHARIR